MKLHEPLPDFELKGTDKQIHAPSEFSDKKGIVLIITCNHCPYARAYIRRIANIVEKYFPKGVGFFAINPNDVSRYPEDSFDNMIPMSKELGLPGHYLYDENQEVAQKLGAQRTPEVFVFDSKRKLVYTGAIDDNWESPENVQRKYLTDALDAILNDKPVPQEQTKAVGCSVKWKVV